MKVTTTFDVYNNTISLSYNLTLYYLDGRYLKRYLSFHKNYSTFLFITDHDANGYQSN